MRRNMETFWLSGLVTRPHDTALVDSHVFILFQISDFDHDPRSIFSLIQIQYVVSRVHPVSNPIELNCTSFSIIISSVYQSTVTNITNINSCSPRGIFEMYSRLYLEQEGTVLPCKLNYKLYAESVNPLGPMRKCI